MAAKFKAKADSANTADNKIVLSVQQVVTYSIFLLTVGASIYTFFKAIPKIDELDKSVNLLRVSNGRVEERINALKETIGTEKSHSDNNGIEAAK
jgi:hypothetical protein